MRLRLSRFDGELEVAYCEAQLVMGEAEIIHIETLESHRRRGLAADLLRELLAVHKPEVVFLEVRRSNAGAIALYEKFGFAKISVRRGYYAGTGDHLAEDALVMKWSA